MKLIQLIYVLVVLILLSSCNTRSDVYEACEMIMDNLNQDEYEKVMNDWLDCLVNGRLNEKSKEQLYENIKGSYIQGMWLGIEGDLSDSYLNYKALSKILTYDELKENLESSDSGIKYYSFLIIAEKGNNVFDMLKLVINDTTKVTTHFGCVIDEITLADLCINTVTEKYYHNYEGYEPSNYQLTQKEKNELDSLVINSRHKLTYQEYLKRNI